MFCGDTDHGPRIWTGNVFVPDLGAEALEEPVPEEEILGWTDPVTGFEEAVARASAKIPGREIPIFLLFDGKEKDPKTLNTLLTTTTAAEDLLEMEPGSLTPETPPVDPRPLDVHELLASGRMYRRAWKKNLPESWIKDEMFLVPITIFTDFAYRGYRETKIAIDVHTRAHGHAWTHRCPNGSSGIGGVPETVELIMEVFGTSPTVSSSLITKADIEEAKAAAKEAKVPGVRYLFDMGLIARIAARLCVAQ